MKKFKVVRDMKQNNVYDDLKKILMSKIDRVSEGEIISVISNIEDANRDELVLKTFFAKVIESRDDIFKETEKLLTMRTELFQIVITLLYLNHYFSEVEEQIYRATIWFDILSFARSSEFLFALYSFRNYINNLKQDEAIDQVKKNQYQEYFEEKYEKMLNLIAPVRDIRFNSEEMYLEEDKGTGYEEISFDDPDSPENFLLYSLGFLAKSDDANLERINVIVSFLTTSNNNLARVIFSRLNNIIEKIKMSIRKFIIINEYRILNDPSYTGVAILSLMEKIGVYEYNLTAFSGLMDKTIEEIKENESYSLFFISAQDIRSEIDTVLDDTIKSIIEVNDFFDSYAVFLKLPEYTMNSLNNTINKILPNFKANLPLAESEYFNTSTSDSELSDDDRPDIAKFIDERLSLLENGNGNFVFQFQDKTNMILLYLGLELLKKNPGYKNYSYINYPLLAMVNKDIIDKSQINSEVFTLLKGKESFLAEEYGIKVIKYINKDNIQSKLKSIYKKLNIIDIVDFRILLDYNIGYTSSIFDGAFYNLEDDIWSSGEMPSELEDFINVIFTTVLENILGRKDDINNTIKDTLEILQNRGRNFKEVFLEMIIRKVFKTISNYAELNETIISSRSLASMKNYISDTSIDFQNEIILRDYKEVRNVFYTDNKNIIDDILKSGSTLIEYLKLYYE
jgi:hypothetical protein